MRASLAKLTRPENRSVLGVVGLTVVALTVGWLLRSSILNATRRVEAGGVTAEVPVDWLVQEGVGDLAFTARSPTSPLPRFSTSRMAGGNVVSLQDVAADRSALRLRMLESFRVLEEVPDEIDGREAYRVSYGYVEAMGEGLPTVVEGLDYYVQSGADVLVITMEADAGAFADALPRFTRFRDSVSLAGEGDP